MKKQAIRISVISIVVNLALALGKLLTGLFGHSSALIADAVHSASDVLTTVIVIVSLLVAGRPADENHEYGHQKFESFATFLLGVILVHVGVKLGINGITDIVNKNYLEAAVPSVITAVAAVVSIAVKEIMYHMTMSVAKKEKSNALKADAWHHRSDALSSVGSLAGILFARFGFPVMDSVACLIICLFILKTAVEIIIGAVKALTDTSCSKDTEEDIRHEVLSVEGVRAIDLLKTRTFGSGFYVDIEIAVDSSLPLYSSHEIAESVHDRVEAAFTDALHCMVHVNPYREGNA